MVGISDPHIILDNYGITGYSDAFTPEFSLSSVTGKGSFGAGAVIADSSGLIVTNNSTDTNFSTSSLMQFQVGGNLKGYIRAFNTPDSTMAIGTINDGTLILGSPPGGGFGTGQPNTEAMRLYATRIGFQTSGTSRLYYTFPTSATQGDVLKANLVTGNQTIGGESGQTVVTLGWAEGDDHDHDNEYAPISGSTVYGDIDSVQITASGGLQSGPTNPVNTQSGNHIQNISHVSSAGYYHVPSAQAAGYAYFPTTSTIASASSSTLGTTLYCTGIKVSTSYIDFDNMGTGAGTDVELDNGYLRYNSSSRRYKENIVDLVIDSSKIYDLVPKSFKMKDVEHPTRTDDGEIDFDTMETKIGLTTFGLIAEEVHEVLPELVIYNEDNEPDAVRYKIISVLLLEEMKKLRARIEVLEGL